MATKNELAAIIFFLRWIATSFHNSDVSRKITEISIKCIYVCYSLCHKCIKRHKRNYRQVHLPKHTHTHLQRLIHAYAHSYPQTHRHMRTDTIIHTHPQIHPHSHPRIHTQTHTHLHTLTHTDGKMHVYVKTILSFFVFPHSIALFLSHFRGILR